MRIAASLLAGAVVVLLFWVAGFDFNERGVVALYCGVMTIFAIVWVYFYPGWHFKD